MNYGRCGLSTCRCHHRATVQCWGLFTTFFTQFRHNPLFYGYPGHHTGRNERQDPLFDYGRTFVLILAWNPHLFSGETFPQAVDVSPDDYAHLQAGNSIYIAGRVTYSDNQHRRWVTESIYELRGIITSPVKVGIPEPLAGDEAT